MKTQTREKIVDFVTKNEKTTAKEIIEYLGLTPPAVFRQLARLLDDQVLQKQGKPPKVFYSLAPSGVIDESVRLPPSAERVINERFLKIGPDGSLQTGRKAFIAWCLTRKQEPTKTANEYVASVKKFDAYKHDGLIDGMQKLQRTFSDVYLDHVYYLDFYSIERFGKTKLGELILYAKQSQNRVLMKMIVSDVRERIVDVVKRFRIDAVGFVPPTVKREVQLMKELERLLQLPLPSLKITKVRTPIVVPQKTLSKLEERVENAHQSLVVEERTPHKNILLIDDAIGSGATMHEVAKQIRKKGLCKGKIIGLALTGSFSGFEVIQEV